jgi:hypothetical protein
MSERCKPSGCGGSREDPATAPTAQGVLVNDETGVSLDGHSTAHVSRQYLANLGKIDNGVVSVSGLWADEGVYSPLDVEPYTPAVYFAKGKQGPAFRSKLVIAGQLIERAIGEGIPFRAVVATTDPQSLPDLSTWYLVSNLPAPSERSLAEAPLPPACLQEVIRL